MKFGKDREGKKSHLVSFLKEKKSKQKFPVVEKAYFQAAEPLSDQL